MKDMEGLDRCTSHSLLLMLLSLLLREPLRGEGKQHFLDNRILCQSPRCGTDYCKSCDVSTRQRL